jgi:hypothetical protein
MAIGRGRRREHPQPTFCSTKKKVREKSKGKSADVVENTTNQHCCTTTKKKVREKSTGKKVRGKKYRKKVGGKKYVEKSTGKKSKGKSHVTSGDITSGQACAMVRSSSIPLKCYFVRAHILLLTSNWKDETQG